MILHRAMRPRNSPQPFLAIHTIIPVLLLLFCLCAYGSPLAWAQGEVPPAIQEISNLFQQGVDALNKRDYTKAEQAFTAAYNRAEAIGEKYSMGTMLDAIANVHMARGDTKQAIALKTQAIELLRAGGNPKGLARGLMNLAVAYRGVGQYDKAITAVEESIGIWESLNDVPGMAAAMFNLSGMYSGAGQYQKAIATLQQVLQIRESTNAGPNALSEVHNDLGTVYQKLGQFALARREYDTALNLAKAANNSGQYANVLNNLGISLLAQGQFAEARAAHQEALALREKGEDPEAVARSLANLSGIAYKEGKFDWALFYARRALSIGEQTGSKPLIAGEFVNIGISLDALGQTRKATESLEHAMALYEGMGNPDGIATAAFNLAHARLKLGDTSGAVTLLNRALQVAQRKGDSVWVAEIQASLGMALDQLGKLPEALEMLLAAHRLMEKTGDNQSLARSYNNLGAIYSHLGKSEEAAKAFAQALALKSKIGNSQDTANTQANLASIYIQQSQWDKAAELLKSAVTNAELVRDTVAAPAEIGALQTGNLSDVYARYASVLLHLGKPEEALVQVERGRGQGLARQAIQGRSEWRGLLPSGDARKLTDATQALRTAEANLRSVEEQVEKLAGVADAQSVRTAQRAASEAQRIRDETQQALTALRNEIAQRRPDFRMLCGLDTPTPEVFTTLAKKYSDTLFLTWAVTPEETLLFALRGSGVQAFPIPVGRVALAKQVMVWRELITPSEEGGPGESAQQEKAAARALYTLLFGAVEKAGLLTASEVKRLVVIGDGPLRELPFAALVDGGGKRLVERFPLTTGVSLRLLAPLPASATEEHSQPAGHGILCIADPGGGDARRADSDLFSGFAPLPAARREGQAIAQFFGDGATKLVGDAATKKAVLPVLGTMRLLHFATHGYLDDRDGLRSGLLLAPSNGGADGEPDELPLLTAAEILNQPLAAELAVLSACETGRGERSGGEGLLGLVWAFRAAGCPSVVASQWSVDDDATGRLMVRFYEGLRAGRRRDDALQDALLSILGDGNGKQSAPYFWAAFQLHGEGSPLRQ